MEVVVPTEAIRRAELQSNSYHQQTNIQLFTAGCPSTTMPNQQCQSTEVKRYRYVTLHWLKIILQLAATPYGYIFR